MISSLRDTHHFHPEDQDSIYRDILIQCKKDLVSAIAKLKSDQMMILVNTLLSLGVILDEDRNMIVKLEDRNYQARELVRSIQKRLIDTQAHQRYSDFKCVLGVYRPQFGDVLGKLEKLESDIVSDQSSEGEL